VTRDILGAADPHGATSLVNLYAAMPSLHVAWAAWCATAIVITTGTRWRHLAWLYPAATILVVLASANHFLLDTAGGLAVAGLGVLAASRITQLLARRLACGLWAAISVGSYAVAGCPVGSTGRAPRLLPVTAPADSP